MRTYTVHQKPFWATREGRDLSEGVVVLADRFNWFAFLLPVVWAAWHRLWLVLVGVIVLGAAVEGGAYALGYDAVASGIVSAALALWLGFEANDLRRWTLRRNGWRDLGILVAASHDDAERRFFQSWRSAAVPVLP